MNSKLKQLRVVLKQDSTWQSFKRSVDMAYDPQFDTWLEEMIRMHKSRSVRAISSKAGTRKLADAGFHDQQCRSRCVEICMLITRNRSGLSRGMEKICRYIESAYDKQLSAAGYRTKTAQKAALQLMLTSAHDKIEQMNAIVELGYEVIEDIDKAYWNIKNGLTAIEIRTKREFSV